MPEILNTGSFKFETFLENLKGENTIKVASIIIDHLKSGKLKVQENPSVAISHVFSYDDKSVVLFLPKGYSFDSATAEYGRLLPEILRHSSETRNADSKYIDGVEEKIRLEIYLQTL